MDKLRVMVVLAAACIALPVLAEDFMVVALPDTQNYSQDYPDLYHAQTQWCADHFLSDNIKFVTHLGDVVNEAATLYQWENARSAMDTLDAASVPYGVCPGNHDFHYPGDYYDPIGTNYLNNFGPQFYEAYEWFRGSSPSGLSNYEVITVDGSDYLFLHVCLETPPTELAWAQQVLNEHPDKPTMLTTHRYLFDWKVDLIGHGRYGDFQYFFEPLYRHDGMKSNDFFSGFVFRNRQIYMVICGHCDGEYRQISLNSSGLPVHEVLADYQTTYGQGGNGWMRLMHFAPESNEIFVQSYSPSLDDYRTGEDSQFTLSVDFEEYTSVNRPSLRFQEGSEGYTGTEDTYIDEDHENSSYGNSSTIIVDDDTANSWFGDYQGQGLILWNNIFQNEVYEGDPAPTRIPAGATIHNASVVLELSNDTDLGDVHYYVYRMTRDWNESSTWNLLGDGISPGSDCDPNMLAEFNGDNDPDSDWWRRFSVTPAVEAWASGVPNYGICILPERLDWNDDGIEIHSSEAGSVLSRPALDVEFSYTVLNTPPTITSPLSASANPAYEGDEVELSVTVAEPNPTDPIILRINGLDLGYSTGPGTVTHDVMMEDDGTYYYMAEVLDDESIVPAGSVEVIVENVAPSVVEINESIVVTVDQLFDFYAIASDPGVHDVISYGWDFDQDSSYDDFIGSAGQWSFDAPGVFKASVEVSDDDGGFGYGDFTIEVTPAIPGDVDNDGDVDLDDFVGFIECLNGPDADPEPSAPLTVEQCLAEFDADEDSDVDLEDYTFFMETLGEEQ